MKIRKINKKYFIIAIIIIIIAISLLIIRSPEDDWIKDEKGQYIEHGAPANIPEEVKIQQEAVICALQLYEQEKSKGTKFSSQCLGKCGDYSVDIVNVPRTEEDNLEKNQCQEYRKGITTHFIELDKDGNIFRIF